MQDDRAARTVLSQGMEGGLKIPDQLSVDCTMAHGIYTVRYLTLMHEYLVLASGPLGMRNLCHGVSISIPFYCADVPRGQTPTGDSDRGTISVS